MIGDFDGVTRFYVSIAIRTANFIYVIRCLSVSLVILLIIAFSFIFVNATCFGLSPKVHLGALLLYYLSMNLLIKCWDFIISFLINLLTVDFLSVALCLVRLNDLS